MIKAMAPLLTAAYSIPLLLIKWQFSLVDRFEYLSRLNLW